MKYITIDFFIDGEDEKVEYPIGALYPRKGYTPSEERIKALMNGDNARGTQLIKPLIELPAKGESAPDAYSETELDRTEIKAKLKELGIDFAKNLSTEKLAELLKAQTAEEE